MLAVVPDSSASTNSKEHETANLRDAARSRIGRPKPVRPPVQRAHQVFAKADCFTRGNRPCTTSSTQISSSSSSQRSARPCKRSCACSSRPCGALARSGYFVAGKLSNLSSSNSSQTRRPSTQQRRAWAGGAALLSMNSNISIQQLLAMFLHQPPNIPQFGRAVSVIDCQCDRAQPELGFHLFPRDVDMGRLASLPAVEMEPIRPDPQYRRHGRILSPSLKLSTRKQNERQSLDKALFRKLR